MDAMGGKCCGESDCMCSATTGSDITTGMAVNETQSTTDWYAENVHKLRPETGYENVTDEYLAEQLSGLRLMMQSPQNRAILTEAAMRLVMRGGDDGYHDMRAVTKPTLEGLEKRLEAVEAMVFPFGVTENANQGR